MDRYLVDFFVNQLGLDGLKRDHQGFYNFRCPLCGDSAKTTRKKRGWILLKPRGVFFHCFNCSAHLSFEFFLKKYHPELYREYVGKKLFDGNDTHQRKEEPIIRVNREYESLDLTPAILLPEDSAARMYLNKRQIPFRMLDRIYYTERFQSWINKKIPDKFPNAPEIDMRIVIPFYNVHKKLFGVQGRGIFGHQMRYYTIMFSDLYPNICGLDRVDKTKRIHITEGFFDSCFVDNCISMNSSAVDFTVLDEFGKRNDIVFIYDNEPRNMFIVKRMKKAVDAGFSIFVWPEHLKQKDINDLIVKGKMTIENVQDIIHSNTYSGLAARVKVRTWHS